MNINSEIRNIFRQFNCVENIDRLRGIPQSEIHSIEKELGIIFPSLYKEIIKEYGPYINRVLIESDLWTDLRGLQKNARDVLIEAEMEHLVIPDKAFVFSCAPDGFTFFLADGSSENPEVFCYYHEHDYFEKFSDILTLKDWYLHHAHLAAKHYVPSWKKHLD